MKKGIVILLISAVLAAFVSCAQEHVHDFSREIVTREPSCVSEGEKQLVCACGETKSFAIPAAGHSWGEWVETEPATCSAPGSRERVCSACGAKENEEIPVDKTAHVAAEWTVTAEPTCEKDGRRESACTACGAALAETVPSPGHRYGEWVTDKEATCEKAGSRHRVCGECGAKDKETVSAKGHSYGSWTIDKEATCEKAGSRHRSCTRCGKKDTESIAAKGHSFGGWVTDTQATCKAEGTRHRVCTACGKKEKGTVVKTDHNWADPTCFAPKTCRICGATSGQPLSHNWSASGTCSRCGAEHLFFLMDEDKPGEEYVGGMFSGTYSSSLTSKEDLTGVIAARKELFAIGLQRGGVLKMFEEAYFIASDFKVTIREENGKEKTYTATMPAGTKLMVLDSSGKKAIMGLLSSGKPFSVHIKEKIGGYYDYYLEVPVTNFKEVYDEYLKK